MRSWSWIEVVKIDWKSISRLFCVTVWIVGVKNGKRRSLWQLSSTHKMFVAKQIDDRGKRGLEFKTFYSTQVDESSTGNDDQGRHCESTYSCSWLHVILWMIFCRTPRRRTVCRCCFGTWAGWDLDVFDGLSTFYTCVASVWLPNTSASTVCR